MFELTVGKNTFCSTADAQSYFVAYGHSDMIGVAPAMLGAYLRRAFTAVNAEEYQGVPVNLLSRAQWPRKGVVIRGVRLDESSIPDDIIAAQCEEARFLYLLDGDDAGLRERLQAAGITSASAGDIKETFGERPLYGRGLRCREAFNLLDPYLIHSFRMMSESDNDVDTLTDPERGAIPEMQY